MINTPINHEDLSLKIINGFGDEFKDLASTNHGCEISISFGELHEKLIYFEAYLEHEVEKNSCVNFLNT